ncbi:MAG: 2-oxoacid:acceptor oxidoreductase subunit alpha [Candidatus Jordarchaeum sp.]|uniref:2-oxoacid:acceptor oxidoreductase subunit alpha n=1 Tax=Candidatus Jordarchaeum sp. TaxID=2823881 RepID=UPI00404ADA24
MGSGFKDIVLESGIYFMSGNEACAEGAITAGCRFFAGYPITPATEIMEIMARRMPEVGGGFLQCEDEISSIAAVIGAVLAGAKGMTATSGPGFSLMQENLGLAVMCEIPCVLVDCQRAGPSTGLPTRVSQGDVMQALWGKHGDGMIVALAPSSPQEMFDLTIRAFNIAEAFRVPVIILADEEVAHTRERVEVPERDELKIVTRRDPRVSKKEFLPFKADERGVPPPLPPLGGGYHFHFTGLSHDEKGYPIDDPKKHLDLVKRLRDKIVNNSRELTFLEKQVTDNSKIAIVSLGSVSRVALKAIVEAKKEGIIVDYLRLITVWPFPYDEVLKVAEGVDYILVPELNAGQIIHTVAEAAKGKAEVIPIMGIARQFKPKEILDEIKKYV